MYSIRVSHNTKSPHWYTNFCMSNEIIEIWHKFDAPLDLDADEAYAWRMNELFRLYRGKWKNIYGVRSGGIISFEDEKDAVAFILKWS